MQKIKTVIALKELTILYNASQPFPCNNVLRKWMGVNTRGCLAGKGTVAFSSSAQLPRGLKESTAQACNNSEPILNFWYSEEMFT